MAKVDESIKKLLIDYHTEQGDKHIRLAKVLFTPRCGEMYLMRFDNEDGVKYSSVDAILHNGYGEPYVSELFSERREGEKWLVEFALSDEEALDEELYEEAIIRGEMDDAD